MLKKLCSEIFSSGVSMYGIYIGSPDMDMAVVKWDPSLPGQRHAGTPLQFLHASLDSNYRGQLHM